MAQVSSAAYALFYVNSMLYGIDCEVIQSFFILDEVYPTPDMEAYYRGLIKNRGQIIPALDLRKFLNTKSTEAEAQELTQMIGQRKADHLNWLDTLSKCVQDNTEFTLATDPHKCAFGKWYDSYHTDDIGMKLYLNQFKNPHDIVHGIAARVLEMKNNNDIEGALELIENTRNKELSKMVQLFDSFEKVYKESRREIVIVVSKGERSIGFVVDKVFSLENLNIDDSYHLEAERFENKEAVKMGIRLSNNEVVLIFDADRFFS